MAIDDDSVVIATNNFGARFDVSVFNIPKADLLGGTPSIANMSRFEALNAATLGDSIQGVVSSAAGDGVSLSGQSGNTGSFTLAINAGTIDSVLGDSIKISDADVQVINGVLASVTFTNGVNIDGSAPHFSQMDIDGARGLGVQVTNAGLQDNAVRGNGLVNLNPTTSGRSM